MTEKLHTIHELSVVNGRVCSVALTQEKNQVSDVCHDNAITKCNIYYMFICLFQVAHNKLLTVVLPLPHIV